MGGKPLSEPMLTRIHWRIYAAPGGDELIFCWDSINRDVTGDLRRHGAHMTPTTCLHQNIKEAPEQQRKWYGIKPCIRIQWVNNSDVANWLLPIRCTCVLMYHKTRQVVYDIFSHIKVNMYFASMILLETISQLDIYQCQADNITPKNVQSTSISPMTIRDLNQNRWEYKKFY